MNILKMLGGGQGNMMFQALAAMRRGENPNAFLKRMAQNNPQMQNLDLDNLEATAQNLCRQKNVNVDEAVGKIQNFMKQ